MLQRIFRFALFFLAISFTKGEFFPLSKVAELNENNWRSMLDGEWMVEFFAPWCPACKSIASTWEEFAVSAGSNNVHVGIVDVTKSPSLSGRFFVTALPTIYHVMNGEFRQYRGTRTKESFLLHIKEKQWKNVEPLSAWKQPNSIHMSLLSYFFKLSHYLKDLNTHLHEDYGLPSWGSYALFAIATIFLGALLGLVLVCIVDFLCPPKKAHRVSFSETKEKVREGGIVEDIPADELEDLAADELEDEDAGVGDEEEEQESTSEAEKNSGSDSDIPESNKISETTKIIESKPQDKKHNEEQDDDDKDEDDNEKTTSQEIRKRKPRKAD